MNKMDFGQAVCAAPGCDVPFTKHSHNQVYHSPQCKRDVENTAKRVYLDQSEMRGDSSIAVPAWPVIQQGPPVKISAPKVKHPKSVWRKAVVIPDIQIGYYRDLAGNLHATHDENAISIARQVVADVQPEQIIIIGDTIDLPELGKFRYSPQFVQTTQSSIDRLTVLLAELRTDAPDAKMFYLAGNHEERLPNYLLDNAMTAFGIRRGNAPNSWPVLSIPFLCRLDELNIEFLPGYPANVHWINDRLRVIHGVKISSTGSSVHRYLNDDRVSTIAGHVHRREWGERTRPSREGAKTVIAACPGCLCRTDGKVPSTKSGMDLDGIPLTSYEDWQQGLAVVSYKPGDSPFIYESISITDGWAMWREKEYLAN